MSKKVQNPNEKSNGFLWAILVVLVLAAALVGYIVVSGQGNKAEALAGFEKQPVSMEVTYEDNAAVLRSSKANDSTPVVDLYEDFSCPACAQLADLTDGDMKTAIEDGKVVVNVRSLNFLNDRSSGNSNKAGKAARLIAESGDAENYWNYRVALLENQSKIVGKWSEDDFASAAENMGVSADIVEKIKSASDDDYKKSADDNSKKLEGDIGEVSTPHVIHEGNDVTSEDWVSTFTNA